MRLTATRLRPQPWACLIARPSRVRWLMSCLSSTANAPVTWAMDSPWGVDVSTGRSRATSAQPSRCARCVIVARSSMLRLSRSSLLTTTADASPRSRASSTSWTPGRLRLLALVEIASPVRMAWSAARRPGRRSARLLPGEALVRVPRPNGQSVPPGALAVVFRGYESVQDAYHVSPSGTCYIAVLQESHFEGVVPE
jgi:hypothetical protein